MAIPEKELEMRRIARQLRQPEGADGIQAGHLMATGNAGMIQRCIDALNLSAGDVLVEIGPGNGSHVRELLTRAPDLTYYGIDISETMISEARRINDDLSQARFELSDGRTIPLPAGFADHVFSINTIYFWEDIPAYLAEIRRILKPKASLTLCFSTGDFMKQLPFTQFGFALFEENDVSQALMEAGFQITETRSNIEKVTSKDGQYVQRPVVVVSAVA